MYVDLDPCVERVSLKHRGGLVSVKELKGALRLHEEVIRWRPMLRSGRVRAV